MTTEKNAAAEERIHQLLHTLGKAYLERKQFAEAYAKLSQLLQLDPDNAEVLEQTALAAIGNQDVSATALNLYEKAVAALPEAEHLLTALATLFSTHEVTSDFAVSICKRAVELAPPDEAQIRSFLQNHYRAAGHMHQAKVEEEKSLLARKDAAETRAYVERLWWNQDFSAATAFLQQMEATEEAQPHKERLLALTSAYETLCQNRTVEAEHEVAVIEAALRSFQAERSLQALRDYLTLYAALPEPEARLARAGEQQEFEEYKFILGLTPMDNFFDNGQEQKAAPRNPFFESVLETLLHSSNGTAKNRKTKPKSWRSYLVGEFRPADLETRNSDFHDALETLRQHLEDLPGSRWVEIGPGFFSTSNDPNAHVEAVVTFLRDFQAQPGQRSPLSATSLLAGWWLVPEQTVNHRPQQLQALLRALHTYHLAQLSRDETSHKSGSRLLATGSTTEALHTLETREFGLTEDFEKQLLPGETVHCVEIVWQDPLASVSAETPYKLKEIALKTPLAHHRNYATYLAEDTLGRQVVVKVIPPPVVARHAREHGSLDAIHAALRAVGRLNHPNIATLYDMGEQDGQLYFAREYAEGAPVRQTRFSGEDSQLEIAATLLQVVRALAAAQSEGVMHHNLKPENIWLTEAGEIKLMDFAVPGFVDLPTGTEDDGHPKPFYLAPELHTGQAPDVRSDIYAVGRLALELLDAHRGEPQSKERDAVPALWQETIVKTTDPNPNKRFQSYSELEQSLRQVQIALLTGDSDSETEA